MHRHTNVIISISFFLLIAGNSALAQQVAGYPYRTGINPAFAGAEGDGKLTLNYNSTYPGSGYKLNSFHLSYDTFLEAAHGGAGLSLLSDHPGGLMNDIRALFSYSYHLRLSRDLFLFGGMNAGLIYRTINRGKLIFPDQIDPLTGVTLPGSEMLNETSNLYFDMGAGFLVVYLNTSVSFSAEHLFQPDLSNGTAPGTELPRYFTLQANSRFGSGNEDLFFIPYLQVSAGGGQFLFAAGGAMEYGRIGAGIVLISEQSGVNLQTSLKAGHGKIDYLYSFRFSVSSENVGLPIALVNQVGIRLSLNVVNKRNIIKTINIPDL